MLIEIAETHPPANGKKLAKVKTRCGEEFQAWPDKLAILQVGQRYEVEVEENNFNGRTYRKITKAKPAPSASATAAPACSGPPPGEEERRFIADMLTAAVRSGIVSAPGFNEANLRSMTAMLRALWRDISRST